MAAVHAGIVKRGADRFGDESKSWRRRTSTVGTTAQWCHSRNCHTARLAGGGVQVRQVTFSPRPGTPGRGVGGEGFLFIISPLTPNSSPPRGEESKNSGRSPCCLAPYNLPRCVPATPIEEPL